MQLTGWGCGGTCNIFRLFKLSLAEAYAPALGNIFITKLSL